MRTFLKWVLPTITGLFFGLVPQALRGELHWTWQFIVLLVAGLLVIQVAAIVIDRRMRHSQH